MLSNAQLHMSLNSHMVEYWLNEMSMRITCSNENYTNVPMPIALLRLIIKYIPQMYAAPITIFSGLNKYTLTQSIDMNWTFRPNHLDMHVNMPGLTILNSFSFSLLPICFSHNRTPDSIIIHKTECAFIIELP